MKIEEKCIRKELELKEPGEGKLNYSVIAGAGGGKTTLLSIRIGNQIMEGTQITEFVIITYTNAAAAELREKIATTLQRLLKNGIADQTKLDNVQNALNNIELIQISTIHAFLLKILREYAFEAHFTLDGEMLENADDEARKRKFFDVWYDKHFKDFARYRDAWTKKNKDSSKPKDCTRDVFWNMFLDLSSVREQVVIDTSDHETLFKSYADDYRKKWMKATTNFRDELNSNMPKKKSYNLLVGSKNIVDLTAELELMISTGVGIIERAVKLSEIIHQIHEMSKGDMSFYGKRYLNEAIPLEAMVPGAGLQEFEWDFHNNYNNYMRLSRDAAFVAEYVLQIQKAYQEDIDKNTTELSNDEILHRAEKLLMEHPDILNKLREKYKKIYVDEFQDTTGLQAKIVELLAGKVGTVHSPIQLKEDNLLIVGDPKQSIYRFTGAEKSVYDSVNDTMDKLPDTLAKKVTLNTNFRSNGDIVNWVNNSFTKLMPGYNPMDTDWIVQEKKALHGVYQYKQEGGMKKEDEVEAVVGLVQKLTGNQAFFIEEYKRPKEEGATGEYELREICYSDFMIITRNTTFMSAYVEKFAEAGITVNVQGKFDLAHDEVLNNFVLVLRYLSCVKNKKYRTTAAQIMVGFDATAKDKSALTDAENRLRELRHLLDEQKMDTPEIIQYLLTHEEHYVPKNHKYEKEAVRAYRIRLHQMVEACISRNDGDLANAVALMEEYLQNKVEREIPLESNENAVRLMNVHKSKGLTGQIVIIADRRSIGAPRFNGFKHAGKYYPSVRYKPNPYGMENVYPAYGFDEALISQARTEQNAESIRLQYVAATRAAHALIIMPVLSGDKNKDKIWFSSEDYNLTSQAYINEWIEEREADTAIYSVKTTAAAGIHQRVKLAELESNLEAADLDALAVSCLVSVTPSGLEPAGTTGYTYTEAGYVKETRPEGSVFGTVMHRVYELLINRFESIKVLTKAEKEAAVEKAINQAIMENHHNFGAGDKAKEFMDFLKPIMLRYFEQVIMPIMVSAKEIYTEYNFSFYVSSTEVERFLADFNSAIKNAKDKIDVTSDKIWINGQADLVVVQEDGSVKVYDYKSDARNGKELNSFVKSMEEKYKGQLQLYRYAIGKAFNVACVDTELIHLYRE